MVSLTIKKMFAILPRKSPSVSISGQAEHTPCTFSVREGLRANGNFQSLCHLDEELKASVRSKWISRVFPGNGLTRGSVLTIK